MTDWRKMLAFSGVDLENSRVARWYHSDAALVIEVEGLLLPAHPSYEKPIPGSFACYKPARLVFPFPQEVVGLLAMSESRLRSDLDGPEDFGTVGGLNIEVGDRYRVSGAFGEVSISSMAVRFEVTSQMQCGRR